MCPLRLVLIFLSATVAGFFVIRGFRSPPQVSDSDADDHPRVSPDHPSSSSSASASASASSSSVNPSPKVSSAVASGLRTLVDMASRRYLWTHLVSSSSSSSHRTQ